MKRYVKSGDTITPSDADLDLHSILFGKVLAWKTKYLQAKGVPETAVNDYLRTSGDLSYSTEIIPTLKAFTDKEVELMDKVVEYYKGE